MSALSEGNQYEPLAPISNAPADIAAAKISETANRDVQIVFLMNTSLSHW
jgi:hypothetical protein